MLRDNYKTASPDRYEILKTNASNNRQIMTQAEFCLWQRLRAGQIGVKFRRQHAISDYIVDFVCLKLRLIIEVDGAYHFVEDQGEDDLIRQHRIEELGYRFLRFTNEEVMFQTDEVVSKIKAVVTAEGNATRQGDKIPDERKT